MCTVVPKASNLSCSSARPISSGAGLAPPFDALSAAILKASTAWPMWYAVYGGVIP